MWFLKDCTSLPDDGQIVPPPIIRRERGDGGGLLDRRSGDGDSLSDGDEHHLPRVAAEDLDFLPCAGAFDDDPGSVLILRSETRNGQPFVILFSASRGILHIQARDDRDWPRGPFRKGEDETGYKKER